MTERYSIFDFAWQRRYGRFMEVEGNRRAVNTIMFGEEHADFDWSYIPPYLEPVDEEGREMERRRQEEIDRLMEEWERKQEEKE